MECHFSFAAPEAHKAIGWEQKRIGLLLRWQWSGSPLVWSGASCISCVIRTCGTVESDWSCMAFNTRARARVCVCARMCVCARTHTHARTRTCVHTGVCCRLFLSGQWSCFQLPPATLPEGVTFRSQVVRLTSRCSLSPASTTENLPTEKVSLECMCA